MDTSSIKVMIQQKLEGVVKERDELKGQRDRITEKLDARLKFAPERPALTADGIEASLARLAKQQSTSSMQLAAEKSLLREMQLLRKMKEELGPYAAFQAEVDSLRTQKSDIIDRLKAVAPSILELRTGLKRLETLESVRASNPGVRVDVQAIQTRELIVDEEHLPRLIGKQGAGLREIESSCGVVLDIEDASRPKEGDWKADGKGKGKGRDKESGPATVKVMGLPAGIEKAVARIESITSQVEIPVPVSASVCSYLVSRGGQPLRDFETGLGVRVRLEREEHTAQVRGLPGAIEAFRKAVQSAESTKHTLTVESRSLPSLIGKGGANFKKLREDTGCEVEVGPREEGAPTTTISLIAMGEGSGMALTLGKLALEALKSEFEELEIPLPIPRDAISWLVGKGGERIQAWQKEAGVYARIARREADGSVSGAEGVAMHQLGSEGAALVLRSTRSGLARAKPLFDNLLLEYRRSNATLTMSSAAVKAIIGPSGASIKKLRVDTGCSIEVDEASDAAALAAQAAAEHTPAVDKPKEAHKKVEAAKPDPKEAAAGKAGGKADGKDEKREERRRPNRADELGLAHGQALITIRGLPEKVPAAISAIQAMVKAFCEARVPASSAVFSALIRNKGEVIRAIQDETGAALDILRDPLAAAEEVTRRSQRGPRGQLIGRPLPAAPASGYVGVVLAAGSEAAVAAAEAKLEALLASKQETSVPLPDSSAVPEFMGKAGATIRALQEETGTEVDVLKGEGIITIVGSADGIAAAKARINTFFEKYARENVSLNVDKSQLPSLIGKGGASLRALEVELGVSIRVEGDGEVHIHGKEDKAGAARDRIVTQCKLDKAVDTMNVDVSILGRLIGRGGGNLRKLEEAHSVSVGVDNVTGVFTFRGDAAAIAAAKAILRKQVREASRAEVEVEVPQDRLGAIIGAKGSRLRQLEAETGATIDLPRDRTVQVVSVKARGTEGAVQRAKVVLTSLAQGHALRVLVRLAHHTGELEGRDRAAVERMQEEYGVAVSCYGQDAQEVEGAGAVPAPSAGSSTVIVTAESEGAVGKAVAAIDRLLAFRFGEGYAVLPVPGGMGAALVPAASNDSEGSPAASASGDHGITLAELKSKFGVGCSFEREGSYVAVWGAPRGVVEACALVTAAANAFHARHGEVAVDAWMLPALIGKKGAGITSLEAASGCKINIDRDSSSAKGKTAVRISALSPAALATGKASVEAKIVALARTRVLLRMPSAAFGTIIGKGGATIRAVQDETGANLDLDRDTGVVVVRGTDVQSTAAAHARIIDLIAEAGFNATVATAGEVAALTEEMPELARADVTAIAGKGGYGFADIAPRGVGISLDRDSGHVVVKATSVEDVKAGVRAVRAAIDRHHRGVELPAPVAPVVPTSSSSAQATKTYANRPIGAAPPTAEELAAEAGKKSRNARRRAKKRTDKADGQGDEVEEEQEEAVPAPVVALHVPAVPAVYHVPAPAPVHGQVDVRHAPARAPVPAAATVQVAAPAKTQTPEELLAGLFGSNYKDLLGGVSAPVLSVAVPAQVPAARQPAAVPAAITAPAARPVSAAPPAVPVTAPGPSSPPRRAGPPGFPSTPQHPPVHTPSKPAAAPAGPVWGAKPAAMFSSSAAPAQVAAAPVQATETSVGDMLASLGISSTSFPSLPVAAPVASSIIPAKLPAAQGRRKA